MTLSTLLIALRYLKAWLRAAASSLVRSLTLTCSSHFCFNGDPMPGPQACCFCPSDTLFVEEDAQGHFLGINGPETETKNDGQCCATINPKPLAIYLPTIASLSVAPVFWIVSLWHRYAGRWWYKKKVIQVSLITIQE